MALLMGIMRQTVDAALEATIVPSFSRWGYGVRRRIHGWEPVSTDLTGRTALLTGGTSGIGLAAATKLAAMGAAVTITGRNRNRGNTAVEHITTRCPGTRATFAELDMGDFDAVRTFAAEFAAAHPRLDALVHNAGALVRDRQETSAGVEVTLAVHLLGPYVLTRGLQQLLAESAPSRVIWMSSGGMYAVKLVLDDLETPAESYDGRAAYARAKRAQVEVVPQLAAELAPQGIAVHALHPGWVATPGVDAGIPLFGKVMGPLLRTPDQGADTLVWLAAGRAETGTSGSFWHDRRVRSTTKLPGTRAADEARRGLIPWIEARIAAAEGH